MLKNINVVKVAGVAGTVLSIAGTLLTGWSGTKTMATLIEKEVAKQIQK